MSNKDKNQLYSNIPINGFLQSEKVCEDGGQILLDHPVTILSDTGSHYVRQDFGSIDHSLKVMVEILTFNMFSLKMTLLFAGLEKNGFSQKNNTQMGFM